MTETSLRRVLITELPFLDHGSGEERVPWTPAAEWPARWLAFPKSGGFAIYRLHLSLGEPLTARIHVTADERYELFVDGALAARGSERGDAAHWFFESYDLTLPAGKHTLLARVWSLGGLAPWAQVSIRPGFLLAAEGAAGTLLSTGVAPWDVQACEGITFADRSAAAGSSLGGGPGFEFDAARIDPAWRLGEAGPFQRAEFGELPATVQSSFVQPNRHYLDPATLPRQRTAPWTAATVRFAADEKVIADPNLAVNMDHDEPAWRQRFASLLEGDRLDIPAHTAVRVVVDLNDYVCQYPHLSFAGGDGAVVRLRYAESLRNVGDDGVDPNRDELDGKTFRGLFDEFRPDGRRHEIGLSWWRAGRYVQLEISTASEPLELIGLRFEETRYDFDLQFKIETNIPQVAEVARAAVRTLLMCSHETHMDCPYYEQLQYVGDTRLQILLAHYLTADDRLARKALRLIESSRHNASSIPLDSAPGTGKLIPPFALWWITMLHDRLVWRGDEAFVASMLPAARGVMEHFVGAIDERGLFVSGRGWNYVDATHGFTYGVPPGGSIGGRSAVLQLQIVYTLAWMAELEERLGFKPLAARWREIAKSMWTAAVAHFWDDGKQRFADDLERTSYSQHAQVLAVLSGQMSDADAQSLIARTAGDKSLVQCNIYFLHYLIEAASKYDGGRFLRERITSWHELIRQGFKTFPEHFGRTRSECHAWSSHVLYHILHTIVGIRPSAGDCDRLEFQPQLLAGEWVRVTVAHPKGPIEIDVRAVGEVEGHITLPHGIELIKPATCQNVKILRR